MLGKKKLSMIKRQESNIHLDFALGSKEVMAEKIKYVQDSVPSGIQFGKLKKEQLLEMIQKKAD